MNIKLFLKHNKYTSDLYKSLKKTKNTLFHGKFVNRSNGNEELCIVLAGYKPFFYPIFFERLEKFLPNNIDVCIISSGLFQNELDVICEKNSWSYLSTKENNVSLVQNVAIDLHPNAKYIYKLDEDIVITEGYFEKMYVAYQHAKEGYYNVRVVAPLIPINGYGHARLLSKLGLEQEYIKKFGDIKVAAGVDRPIENDPDVAKFFWGEGEIFPHIDDLNYQLSKEPLNELPCAIKLSIGAILFERSLWDEMERFSVSRRGCHMGGDEIELCTHCMLHSCPIMVSENVAVGHLSFGLQNSAMREYFDKHKKQFEIKEIR